MPSSGAPEFSGNLRRPASAGGIGYRLPVRRGNWVVQGGLPQQGALKKENNPSQAPLWARPPKYKLCGAPENVIQGKAPAEAGRLNTSNTAHRRMLYRVKPLLRQVA